MEEDEQIGSLAKISVCPGIGVFYILEAHNENRNTHRVHIGV